MKFLKTMNKKQKKSRSSVGPILMSALGAAALGIIGMFLLDPRSGRRRRKLIADKARHYQKSGVEGVSRQTRNLRNRAKGSFIEGRKALMNSRFFNRMNRDEQSSPTAHA